MGLNGLVLLERVGMGWYGLVRIGKGLVKGW